MIKEVVLLLVILFLVMGCADEEKKITPTSVQIDDSFCKTEGAGFVGIDVGGGVVVGDSNTHTECYVVINKKAYHLFTEMGMRDEDEYAYVRSLKPGNMYCFEVDETFRMVTPLEGCNAFI